MAWQLQTRMATASRDQPSEHVRDVERYGNVWTTTEELTMARNIGKALTPHNTTLIVGSMSPSTTPEGSSLGSRTSSKDERESIQQLGDQGGIQQLADPTAACACCCVGRHVHAHEVGHRGGEGWVEAAYQPRAQCGLAKPLSARGSQQKGAGADEDFSSCRLEVHRSRTRSLGCLVEGRHKLRRLRAVRGALPKLSQLEETYGRQLLLVQ